MKKAFTMLELIMVIVIIGILAAVIMPRTGSNKTAEAAVKLISDIRYTQHLAMIDDKYGENTAGVVDWYKKIWRIRFDTNDSYSIVSDRFAKDPITREDMTGIDLHALYGVNLSATGGCIQAVANGIVGFDHIGRPIVDVPSLTSSYSGALVSKLMNTDCTVTIQGDGPDVVLTLRPETGYVSMQ